MVSKVLTEQRKFNTEIEYRNNLCTHFCFSELLILREKKVCGFSFWPLEYQKITI